MPVERRSRTRPDSYPRGLRWLVPEHQRATVRYHPLAVWLSVGILITGLSQLLHPVPSSTDIALPMWLRVAFNVVWLVGGGLSVFGILRGKARYEAAGMALLATGLAVDFACILRVDTERAWVAGFVVALCIGCAKRAWILTKGYEVSVGRKE